MIDDRTWERLGAAAGLAFVVLMVLATFLYPQQPRIDSSATKTLAWVHSHRAGLETGMIFGLFGSGVFLWFASHLRHVLERAEGGAESLSPIVFASGIAAAITNALGAVPIGLLAIMDAQGGIQNADVVRMLAISTQVLYALFAIMAAMFLASSGIAMVRKELVSPRLGWLSLLAAVLNGIAVVTSMSFATYHGAGWSIPGWGAYIGFLLVVLLTSVSLLRAKATSPTPTAVMAAAA